MSTAESAQPWHPFWLLYKKLFRFRCTGKATQYATDASDLATQHGSEHRITDILTTSIDRVYSGYGTPTFSARAVIETKISPTAMPTRKVQNDPPLVCSDSPISKQTKQDSKLFCGHNQAKDGDDLSLHRQPLFTRAIFSGPDKNCGSTAYSLRFKTVSTSPDPPIVLLCPLPSSPSPSLPLPHSRQNSQPCVLASTSSSSRTSFALSACSSASWVAQWEAQYDEESPQE